MAPLTTDVNQVLSKPGATLSDELAKIGQR